MLSFHLSQRLPEGLFPVSLRVNIFEELQFSSILTTWPVYLNLLHLITANQNNNNNNNNFFETEHISAYEKSWHQNRECSRKRLMENFHRWKEKLSILYVWMEIKLYIKSILLLFLLLCFIFLLFVVEYTVLNYWTNYNLAQDIQLIIKDWRSALCWVSAAVIRQQLKGLAQHWSNSPQF